MNKQTRLQMALFPSERLNLYPLSADEMLELIEVMFDAEITQGRSLDISDKTLMADKIRATRKSYAHLRDASQKA